MKLSGLKSSTESIKHDGIRRLLQRIRQPHLRWCSGHCGGSRSLYTTAFHATTNTTANEGVESIVCMLVVARLDNCRVQCLVIGVACGQQRR